MAQSYNLTNEVSTSGSKVKGFDELEQGMPRSQQSDKRSTMPKGGYVFGLSNPRLRPDVPKGQ